MANEEDRIIIKTTFSHHRGNTLVMKCARTHDDGDDDDKKSNQKRDGVSLNWVINMLAESIAFALYANAFASTQMNNHL